MRSNPNEDEGGQQPITVLLTTKAGARMNFFPCFIYVATLESEIEWKRENQIVVPIPHQSVLMSPGNLKKRPIGPS